jgi:hypothetical protein
LLDKTILITRTNYESTTSYLYYWSAKVLNLVRARYASVLCIDGSKVTRKEVAGRIKKVKPDYIHFNGHGGADVLFGHNNEVVVDSSNVTILQNAVVYALSCQSANKLGPLATSKGAKAFLKQQVARFKLVTAHIFHTYYGIENI